MGPVAPDAAQVVAAEVETVVREQLVGPLVIERRPLELEEQQHRLDRRRALLHELQLGAAGGIGRVGGKAQRGIGAGLADQLVNLGQLVHGRGETGGIELGDLAGVRAGEVLGAARGLVELALDACVAVAVEKRAQVPLGPEQLRILQMLAGRGHVPGG